MRQLAPITERVDGRGADAEPGRYLPNAEQVIHASRDAAKSRGQGGDKLLTKLSISLRSVGLGGAPTSEEKRRIKSRCDRLDTLGIGLITDWSQVRILEGPLLLLSARAELAARARARTAASGELGTK